MSRITDGCQPVILIAIVDAVLVGSKFPEGIACGVVSKGSDARCGMLHLSSVACPVVQALGGFTCIIRYFLQLIYAVVFE